MLVHLRILFEILQKKQKLNKLFQRLEQKLLLAFCLLKFTVPISTGQAGFHHLANTSGSDQNLTKRNGLLRNFQLFYIIKL